MVHQWVRGDPPRPGTRTRLSTQTTLQIRNIEPLGADIVEIEEAGTGLVQLADPVPVRTVLFDDGDFVEVAWYGYGAPEVVLDDVAGAAVDAVDLVDGMFAARAFGRIGVGEEAAYLLAAFAIIRAGFVAPLDIGSP